ncbi:MAG: maleylpyruvate isomerase N-terminal domain-containing protein [Isosphaeraceae bacterium]
MKRPEPILAWHLFRELHGHLLDLLRSLANDDWHSPTVCSAWCVKDIASHLLDGDLRRLSFQRDGYMPPDAPTGFDSHAALVAYLTRLNADWTTATRRLSTRTLIRLLEVSGVEVAELFELSDPFGPATFPVGWAGDSHSVMWFDIAREYTERWHHQRQIALAVGRPTPIDARRLYHPVLDTFIRALPYALRRADAPDGSAFVVSIEGEAGGDWHARRMDGGWTLFEGMSGSPAARVVIDQGDAWRLFTKRTDRATARARFPGIRIEGDAGLGGSVLEMVAIMA